MRVLITGSYGQLGSEIKALAIDFKNITLFSTDIDNLDISNQDAIDDFISKNNIELIVNCAAYTAVDKAEDEPEQAELINAIAVKKLANIAEKYRIFLIHVSTDYVFDGSKNTPYHEEDQTNPNSVYGQSKLKGEEVLLNSNIQWMIIRTSWLYSSYGNNFVKTILRISEANEQIKVVFDQIGTPTYARDLAKTILEIITKTDYDNSKFVKGIYHFSNEGVCSWYDFALEIVKNRNINCYVKPVLSHEFPTKANRPFYSVLNKQKICRTFDIKIPHWSDSLPHCLEKL